MQTRLRQIKWLILACGALTLTPCFAEAPVYDADTMQMEDTQDYQPPPRPPEQQSGYANAGAQSSSYQDDTTALSMEERIRRAERQISNIQNNDLSTRVDSLQSQVQSLRGDLEQLMHQLTQLQTQQQSLYTDLDRRVAQMKQAPQVAANNPPPPIGKDLPGTNPKDADKPAVVADDQPNVAEEQTIYQTAYNQIKSKKYEDAVATLQGMLRKYPKGQFAANAHYWLGELYGLMGNSDQAASEFDIVVNNYPDSPRISDAQLKLGLIYAGQSRWKDAKAAFRKVINNYPGTAASRLASEQMKQLRLAGH